TSSERPLRRGRGLVLAVSNPLGLLHLHVPRKAEKAAAAEHGNQVEAHADNAANPARLRGSLAVGVHRAGADVAEVPLADTPRGDAEAEPERCQRPANEESCSADDSEGEDQSTPMRLRNPAVGPAPWTVLVFFLLEFACDLSSLSLLSALAT